MSVKRLSVFTFTSSPKSISLMKYSQLKWLNFRCFRNMTTNVDVSALRIKYLEKRDIFLESSIDRKEPFSLFNKWFQEALDTPEIIEPNAMNLATATKDGIPSSRYILVKGIDNRGFTFYTNYESRKARELGENPNAAISVYWLPLRRSIRIEGTVEKLSRDESEAYFHQRPRASQIGAVASPQSRPIPNREYLDEKESKIKESLGADGVVPLPNWGGYLLTPHTIEFWQGQTNRLHDRIRFRRGNEAGDIKLIDEKLIHQGEDGWMYERLAP